MTIGAQATFLLSFGIRSRQGSDLLPLLDNLSQLKGVRSAGT
jgi:hypothetical protein